jgi:hypothetical protein
MSRARDRADGDFAGKELIFDADGDTSITADTDDQIDIRIAGADDFQFTANTFTAQSGSTIAAQALTATTITATGDISFDGGSFVFNESSADKDFRVESNGQANMFFVNGGTDRIGVMTNSPDANHAVHIQSGGYRSNDSDSIGLLIGADIGATTFSDSTRKIGGISFAHYDTDEPNFNAIRFDSQSSTSILTLGGTGETNATEIIQFNCAADDTDVSTMVEPARMTSTSTVFNNDGINMDFQVKTQGQTLFHIDGAENEVGIGTTTPSGHSSPNGAKLVVHTSSGASMIQINATGSSQSSGIEFTDDATQGQIHYFHGNNSLTFTVAGTQHFSIASNGDLTATDTSISSISDERLKKDINDYSYDLETFKKFKPKTFNWKNPAQHGDKSGVRGFSAQDILAVDNYLVSQTDIEPNTGLGNLDAEADLIPKDSDGKRLSYTSKLDGNDAMYVSVIQQLITKIETLEAKVKTLESA